MPRQEISNMKNKDVWYIVYGTLLLRLHRYDPVMIQNNGIEETFTIQVIKKSLSALA
jgi:hypothetical protein